MERGIRRLVRGQLADLVNFSKKFIKNLENQILNAFFDGITPNSINALVKH